MADRPIFLFTDFTSAGPYVGQVRAEILRVAPRACVVDLMHDAPDAVNEDASVQEAVQMALETERDAVPVVSESAQLPYTARVCRK